MPANLPRETTREPKFVHVNFRVEQSMHAYLRDQADRGYSDVSKVIRRLIANDMNASDDRMAA